MIEPGRSFHNLGAAAWKDRSPSVVSILPLQGARSKEQGARSKEQGARSKEQGARSKPSLERKSYLPMSLTEISSLM